jgi:3-hydroxyisobutyrate dehydrogenase-like beta-hydroxyacid dehydrogenase
MRTVGFLGFGEAGSTMARGLRSAGMSGIVAYDVASEDSPLVRRRAAEAGVELLARPQDLCQRADLLVSAVVCTEAAAAASSVAPHLDARHAYLDINSVAPAVKRAIGVDLASRAVSYVDVAVMTNVTSDLTALPMLVAGPEASEVQSWFADVPLHVTVVSSTVGDASRIKMLRSLFVKGLEALCLEVMLAAYPNGVHERVLSSFEETFGAYSFPELVRHLIERHAVHGERRANELHEVANALREMGVEPMLAEAAYERASWDVRRGLQASFAGGEDPEWTEVLEVLCGLASEERP